MTVNLKSVAQYFDDEGVLRSSEEVPLVETLPDLSTKSTMKNMENINVCSPRLTSCAAETLCSPSWLQQPGTSLAAPPVPRPLCRSALRRRPSPPTLAHDCLLGQFHLRTMRPNWVSSLFVSRGKYCRRKSWISFCGNEENRVKK